MQNRTQHYCIHPVAMVLLIVFTIPVVTSCDGGKDLTLATNLPETSFAKIGGHLADALNEDGGLTVSLLTGEQYNGGVNIALIEQGSVDLAISSSALAAERNSSVRTVLPLYPEIIVVMYHPSLGKPANLSELFRNRRVGVGPEGHLHSRFVIDLLDEFGVPINEYTPVYTAIDQMRVSSNEMDVFVTIAGADRRRIEEEISAGAMLYPLGDYRLAGLGSRVDGYILRHPELQSFIIPKNSINQYPEEPVLTLAFPVTLIAHKDLSAETVYGIVDTILGNASYLARQDPMLGFLSYDFDTTRLNFALHEGTHRYLNRDQPGFLERYAEVMALVTTLLLLVFGAVGSARRVIRQRKKDRIDNYYLAVEAIGKQTGGDSDSLRQALTMLEDLKSRAIEQLRQETLQADESFSIFLALLHDISNRFQQKLRDRADIGIDEIE